MGLQPLNGELTTHSHHVGRDTYNVTKSESSLSMREFRVQLCRNAAATMVEEGKLGNEIAETS